MNIDPTKKVDLSDAWIKFNIAKDYEASEMVTGLWTVGFRCPGTDFGPRMNWFGDAYGDTLKEAISRAREKAYAECRISLRSPVTVVYYSGRFNLMTMSFESGDEHKQVVVFDEGITDMT